jgi:hypothetical protein
VSDKKVGKIKLEEEYIWERHVTTLFRNYCHPTAFQNIQDETILPISSKKRNK